MTTPLRVLAFDPGYERLGVAVVERRGGKDILLHSECVRTSAKLPFPERLALLGDAAQKLITEWKPSALALEEVYFEKNAKTAIHVAQVMGMLNYIAASRRLVVYQYTPLEVKVAITGYGRGDKTAVAAMVPRLVKLPARKRLDDELDAIAIGLTCAASVRVPIGK
ncbi:MAG TPA: crossover junction endodeoxyribonuclease RuvC [Candidatus Paceibacterota bacterium]|nr:crossover junction endodeoxyribonuclease RuvC [Candidatus Paceibacterota bacterium]